MKSQDVIIIFKATCYVAIGFCGAMCSGLSQWSNDGSWPGTVNWIVILGAASVAGATQLLGFLSGSYADYIKKQDASTGIVTAVVKTTPESASQLTTQPTVQTTIVTDAKPDQTSLTGLKQGI
jgi:hypothetical protein